MVLKPALSNLIMELEKVRSVVRNIVQALETHGRDDVLELLQTAHRCVNILQHIIERAAQLNGESVQLVMELVEKIQVVLYEYREHLTEPQRSPIGLKSSPAWLRGHRKLEQYNSLLLSEMMVLVELTNHAIQQQRDSDEQQLPTTEIEEPRVEILDSDGLNLWTELFGATTFMVDVNKLVRGLLKRLDAPLSSSERKVLLQVLDYSNTGQISSLRWNEFLKGFGPMRLCLHNLQEIFAKPWFYAFVSRDAATKLLIVEPTGTFLVRFSSTMPGSFALAHTMDNSHVNHVIIHTRESGFAVVDGDGNDKVLPSISQLIDAFPAILTRPYAQTFVRQPWWHGDITSDEASVLLRDKKPGTFLIRFSAQRGCFAISYVDENGGVEKGLVIGSEQGYQLSSKLFSSLEEMVDSLVQWKVLTEPYKNTTNEMNDKMRKRIVTEIVSTERSYVATIERVLTYFMPQFEANSNVPPADVKTIFGNIESIVSMHVPFLQSLERVIECWDADSATVGPHFLDLVPKMPPVYSSYIINYAESLKVLDRLSLRTEFKDFLEQVLARQPQDMQSQLDLQTHLIMPGRRPPRYVLLLMDLLKHTSGAHCDYDALSDALTQLKAALDQINQKARVGAADDADLVRQKRTQMSGIVTDAKSADQKNDVYYFRRILIGVGLAFLAIYALMQYVS